MSSLARTFNRMAVDLESRATALAESDRARRQLLADVSHELMTPLSAIRGYVETLGMADLPIDRGHPQALPRHRRTGNAQARSHHRRPARSRAARRRRRSIARRAGGGRRSLQAYFRSTRAGAARSRIVARIEIAPGTPQILGDAGRLEQALQNLAANAIRHTPAGGRVALEAAHATTACGSRCGIRAPASRRNTCRACSIGSTRWMRRGRARRAVGKRPRPLDRPGHHRTPRRHGHRVERRRRRRDVRAGSAVIRPERPAATMP